jgi:ClpP class serine protease
VFGVVHDTSEVAQKLGIKVHVVKDGGEHKGAGTPGTPVTDEQVAHLQDLAAQMGSMFRSAIMRGRGMTSDQLQKVYGGQIFIGARARSAGLVDGITSFDNVLAKLATYKPAAQPAQGE